MTEPTASRPTRPAALVTGGSSGIGLAYAELLADEGYDLTVVARDADRLAGAAEKLRALGTTVVEAPADLSVEADLVRAFRAHHDAFGRLDVLVNNAGVATLGPIESVTAELVDDLYGLNVRAIFLAYREAVGWLAEAAAERGQAFVFNVASIAARSPRENFALYASTKAAVLNLNQAMNHELLARGIKSTAVCPAFVDTPFTDGVKSVFPAETMLRPSDVAELTRPLLHLSPVALVPELVLERIG